MTASSSTPATAATDTHAASTVAPLVHAQVHAQIPGEKHAARVPQISPELNGLAEAEAEGAPHNTWKTLRTLLGYVWQTPYRVGIALACLAAAKVANVAVPMLLEQMVDMLKTMVDAASGTSLPALITLPVAGLIIGYGLVRLASTAFAELRDVVFIKVTQRAVRQVALETFNHLHRLSLAYHLDRQTGGVTRDVHRGTRGIGTLLSIMIFNILPTIFEIGLVTAILSIGYNWRFAFITIGILICYIVFTIWVTEWRSKTQRSLNELDSQVNACAVDSLLNYETVKYFGNEAFESQRYDGTLQRWQRAAVQNEITLGILNSGQTAIIAIGITVLIWVAAQGVLDGTMTVGGLVAVNIYLIQLYIPLNFLGTAYREIKQAITDMERMFGLLHEEAQVVDPPNAQTLATRAASVRFEQVDFGYNPTRQILHGVDFAIPAGKTVAVVGSSGAGKSTLSRLLFRFYDTSGGRVLINGCDVRNLTQQSLRAHIGIVPQDTVLFNDTIYYNIAYGRPEASREEITEAARSAHILSFIEHLPEGWDTTVGERGLKLSGGEKQRVAIARTILKNPPILIFDEATSALDSATEKAIQAELSGIAANRTTLIIAHRLSTVIGADEILVLDAGRVVERGCHPQLLAQGGRYAHMWALQQQSQTSARGA